MHINIIGHEVDGKLEPSKVNGFYTSYKDLANSLDEGQIVWVSAIETFSSGGVKLLCHSRVEKISDTSYKLGKTSRYCFPHPIQSKVYKIKK